MQHCCVRKVPQRRVDNLSIPQEEEVEKIASMPKKLEVKALVQKPAMRPMTIAFYDKGGP